MGKLCDEKGAAMVTALMLTMLALVISMTLLYSVIMGTKISASQKRYRTALAAAHGGLELFTQELIPRLLSDTSQGSLQGDFSQISLQLPQYDCLRQKLDHPTSQWIACTDPRQLTADPGQAPDVTFRLRGDQGTATGYNVSTKIVDTVPGNSDRSGYDLLDPGYAVAGSDQVVHPQHVPAIYNIAVQGVMEGAGSREKARLSVLFAY